jgi:hypothetical protein
MPILKHFWVAVLHTLLKWLILAMGNTSAMKSCFILQVLGLLYTQTKSRDHENLRALENHPRFYHGK